jgi:hypothetical protein
MPLQPGKSQAASPDSGPPKSPGETSPTAADEFTTGGHAQRARSLHDEAAVLIDLMGDV